MSKKNPEEICNGCTYFQPDAETPANQPKPKSAQGTCRRRAPAPTGFPRVQSHQWCGEWEDENADTSKQ